MKVDAIGALAALATKLFGGDGPQAAPGTTQASLSSGPNGLPPKMQPGEPDYFKDLGAQRVKMRYGPYKAPSADQFTLNTIMSGEGGMLDSIHPNDQKPCTECMITHIQAGLEFPNGTVANTDSGLWLHHVILSLDAPDRHDRVCKWMPKERIFSSGNERMPVDLTSKGTVRAGYPFYTKDKLRVTLELENQNKFAQEVYLTVTFDYMPFVKQKEFKEVGAMWFDVSNCGFSFMSVKDTPKFDYTMNEWQSTVNGSLLFVGGHLHDGGTNVIVRQNNQTVCDSVATYGAAKGFVSQSGKDMGMPHISNMTTCSSFGKIAKNDRWDITAAYDLRRYKAMANDKGMKDKVMGIAIMYATLE